MGSATSLLLLLAMAGAARPQPSLDLFCTELDKAAKTLGVSEQFDFCYAGHNYPYQAWVMGRLIGLDETIAEDRTVYNKFRVRYLAWHEVCHVYMGHAWNATTTAGQKSKDHEEVAQCMRMGMGQAKYRLWRAILTEEYGGQW